MARKKVKIRIPRFDMCVLLFWYTTEMLFRTTAVSIAGIQTEVLNTISSYLVLLLLLVQIVCFQRYRKQELIRIALFGILVIIVTIQSGFTNVLMSFTLFILAAKNLDLDRVIRMVFHINLILIPLIILLCGMGVLGDYTIYRGIFLIRHSLGFEHPNTLGQRVFILVACHFYLHFPKLRLRDFLLAIGAAVFCYIVPNSLTATVLLVLMVVAFLLDGFAKRIKKEKVFQYGLIAGAFICNAGSVLYSFIDLTPYEWLILLNASISSRFSSSHRIMEIYEIKWFGQLVDYKSVTTEKLFLDNSYISILMMYGIVMFVVFSILYIKNMFIQIKKQNTALVVFLFLTAVYGIMERTLFMMSVNIFLLSLADVFYRLPDGTNNYRFKKTRFIKSKAVRSSVFNF